MVWVWTCFCVLMLQFEMGSEAPAKSSARSVPAQVHTAERNSSLQTMPLELVHAAFTP